MPSLTDLDQAWGPAAATGALAGLRVIDLGHYIAGPLTATMLADQGATVIRINPPGGPRRSGPENAFLHRRRRIIELNLKDERDVSRAQKLIASADVVIENFRPGVAERLGVGPERSCAHNPRLLYCSLPGFGKSDPRAAQPGWEGVVMAAAGAYTSDVSWTSIPGTADLPTASTPSHLPLASVFAAMEAALGIAAALIARDRDGRGQWIEVALFDALFEAIGNRAFSRERNRPVYTHFGSGFYHCADGRYVAFFGGFFRHLQWLVEIMGGQSWIEEGLVNFERLKSDREAEAEVRRRMTAIFATKSAAEWETLSRRHGLPLGMLRSTSEWIDEPHAVRSGTLIDISDPELGHIRVPGSAAVLHGIDEHCPAIRSGVANDLSIIEAIDAELEASGPSDRVVASSGRDKYPARALPLAGVKVIDLTRILAAPTASKLLGQLGADVIKIDQDPDEMEANGPMPFAHEHVNRGKRTMIFDVKSEEGLDIFKRLANAADVVVQNSTMGVAERLGIGWTSLQSYAPNTILVYLNANGREGPWAGDRGYADLATMLTGISARAIGDDIPASGSWVALHTPPWSYTDYAAGVLGAFGAVLALHERARSGKARLVETSLLRATALEQLLEIFEPLGADGRPIRAPAPDNGEFPNDIAGVPLSRIYRTADAALFVHIPENRLDAALQAIGVGKAARASGASGQGVASLLADALAALSTADAAHALLGAGVGAHQAMSVEQLMETGGMADQRGLRLEDNSPVFGTVLMPGPVIRFAETPMRRGFLPGSFGCDRKDILATFAPAQEGASCA